MKQNLLFHFILSNAITYIKPARILAVFPTPSISHQVVFRPLTQELAKRGHEIVIITPNPAFPKGQTPANLTEIDVHNLSYSKWNQLIAPAEGENRDWFTQMEIIFSVLQDIFEDQMKTKDVKMLLTKKSNYFDLLLLEAFVKPALGLSHVFKAPVIQISSFLSLPYNIYAVGAYSHPVLYPNLIRDRLHNLTMWEKIMQMIKEIKYLLLLHSLNIKDNAVLTKIFGDDVPTLEKLYNNIEMLFLNIHPIWENNRPVPPNVIHLGGLHQLSGKEIPKDLKLLLDASENDVIYFSLGTNVKPSLLPPGKLRIIMNVLARLPFTILMKWDDDEFRGRLKNVIVSKWWPQPDILKHPKVKLFVTQGGLQSTDEAITAGVPLVALPMLCDQWYNAEKYLYYQIGLKLDIQTLTEEDFENAIITVIKDKRLSPVFPFTAELVVNYNLKLQLGNYKFIGANTGIETSFGENIVKLRELIQDQTQKPLDRAVWWIEHVLRHGGARHLRSPAASMSWVEYLEFKLILVLILMTLTSIFMLVAVVKMLVNCRSFGIKMKFKTA